MNCYNKHINTFWILIKYTCITMFLAVCISLTGCNGKSNSTLQDTLEVEESSGDKTVVEENIEEGDTSQEEIKDRKVTSEIELVDYSEFFGGLEGCAVFLNRDTSVYTMYNKELCEERSSPCSTFKIIATLMGLDKGVLSSVDTTMGYDGTKYPLDNWNKDLNLSDAFKESCVWYFRKVIDQVGQSDVQSYVDKLNYGNCDINEWKGSGINPFPELNGFWLESSLEISPIEQVEVLENIFEDKTDFSKENVNTLKEIMLVENMENVAVYGKTGTGKNSDTMQNSNGWFVGMFEDSTNSYYFAIHLTDKNEEVSGLMAKDIALNIISKCYGY